MRECGVLLPVASLPSKYGIGCFSKAAYNFVDTLKEGNQKYWQILPLGATGFADSPYQSFSAYAGNPYFIDLDQLIKQQLITQEECESLDFGSNQRYIDYEKIYLSRFKVLRLAFDRAKHSLGKDFITFKKKNKFWLDNYVLYMAVKNHFGGRSWMEWDDDIRLRDKKAVDRYTKALSDHMDFHRYIQFLFDQQWSGLKAYANKQGIKIIGDIPIYVALDSADTWSDSQLFLFDEDKRPIEVSGCPPDAFAAQGQLWGNPIYNWEKHKESNYQWWINRMQYSTYLYDVVRIDHFRGIDEYYSICAGEPTAENGIWKKGPGFELIKAINENIGRVDIIAEDLGYLTDSVKELLEKSQYPGMKVLQFAFDAREAGNYLPHNYERNAVVYTGTHDNDTLLGWYRKLKKEDKELANNYATITGEKDCCKQIIKLAYASVARLVIIPIQDFMELGSEARINLPSTIGDNWRWRLKEGEITEEITDFMVQLTKLYER